MTSTLSDHCATNRTEGSCNCLNFIDKKLSFDVKTEAICKTLLILIHHEGIYLIPLLIVAVFLCLNTEPFIVLPFNV